MTQSEFGIKVGFANSGALKLDATSDLHNQKSFAGRIFREDGVASVCVYDAKGTAKLYLKKTPSGVIREEN